MNEFPASGDGQVVNKKGLCFAIYILYIIGLFTGITALIGVVIAHIQVGSAASVEKSHLDFQIRTFWYGLLIMVIGGALSLVLIGYAVLLFWLVWLIVRCVKGLLLLNENRPIANPTSFMFG